MGSSTSRFIRSQSITFMSAKANNSDKLKYYYEKLDPSSSEQRFKIMDDLLTNNVKLCSVFEDLGLEWPECEDKVGDFLDNISDEQALKIIECLDQ